MMLVVAVVLQTECDHKTKRGNKRSMNKYAQSHEQFAFLMIRMSTSDLYVSVVLAFFSKDVENQIFPI